MFTLFSVNAATFGEDSYVEMEATAVAQAKACDTLFYDHYSATETAFIEH